MFPHLQNLMGAYFHQDHDLMGENDEAILADFAGRHGAEDISAVIAEIEMILAGPRKGLLTRFESEVSAFDMRIGENDNEAHAWLVQARQVLRDALA